MKAQDYINATLLELEKLTTPQLMALRKSAFRSTYKCSCAIHCGDEVLTKQQQDHNKLVYALGEKIAAILPGREHMPNKIEAKATRQEAARRRKFGK